MRKNTKAILVFLCALVMVLTGIGMPVASAATTLDGLTVDYIFDSLGESLQYGVVAHRWEQANHAETSACVDELYKMTDTVFSNSDITYSYALDYSLTVDVTAPQDKTLQGMSFALFTYNGGEYVRCDANVAPVQKVETAVSSTTLEWKISGDLRNERLYVFQLDQDGTGYVENGSKNSADLVVTYGPSISASAQNEIYLGKVIFPAEKGLNEAMGIFNTPYTHSPSLTLGGGVQLYSRGENDTMVALDVENLPADLNLGEVFVDYFYEADGQLKKAQMKLDSVKVKNGKFMIGDSEIDVKLDNRGENHVADTLLKDASEFSYIVGNMGGGEISDKSIPPKGPSTVTGPVDEDGTFVSIYDVEVGEDGKFIVKDDMGWLNDSRVDDKSKVGIPIQENEYVIINLICPSNDPSSVVTLAPGTSDITYFVEDGQTKGEVVGWADGGNTDSGASQRVIFNFVYVDENGLMQPYQGKVVPNNGHGGTLLVPEGRVEVTSNVHNGGIIANEVLNAGQEIHQRTMKTQGRSTWVRMDCGTIWLQKASVGYNWNTKPYGKWEDMSSKVDLSGAVFGVYSKKDCKEDSLVMTMTTDETGKATSDLLSAGTYWVKEITPLKDHNISNEVVEVKVVAGQPTQVKGAGYKVKPSNGQPGYEVVKPGAYANQQNNGFTSLRLVKNDEFGNVLQGAEFGVYDEDGKLIVSAKSNRNGVVLFENVPLRQTSATNTSVTYTIKEITPPEGYHQNNSSIEVTLNKKDHRDKIVTIDGNGNAAGEAFINEIIRGHMALKKQDAVTNMPLPGAEFTIYSDAACTKDVGKMTTGFLQYDVMGYYGAVAVERDLIPGTYYVVETKVPDGYELPYEMVNGQKVDKVYTVEVLPGEMVDVVTGDKLESDWWYGIEIPAESYATPIGNTQVITVSGQKTWHDDGDTSNRPQQVTIELYKKMTGDTQETFVARTQISGPDWTFEFKTDWDNKKLPRYDEKGKEIEYIVREGRDGLGYYYSFVKQDKAENGNIMATVANTIKKTKVTGHKVWEDKLEAEKHPERITFLLFAEMEGELIPINYSYGGQMNATGYRHEGYKFTFENLPTYDVNGDPVTYVVKEAESDDYYLVDSDSTSTTENNTTTVDFTLTNRLTVPLKGTKTWDDGGRTNRPEVELEIKQNNRPFPLTGLGALKGVEVIWDKETDPDVWTWKVVGLPKYDAAGNVYTYTVTEKPMSGYEQKVTTDENGIHFTNTLKGMGRIRLYKENEAGERLNGVEFGLYTDPNCTPESRVDGVYKTEHKDGSNEDGKLEIKDIPYGTYYLKEETTPEGYVENTKIYKVEVYKPGAEPSDIENGDKANTDNPDDPNPPMNVVVNKRADKKTSVTLDVTKELKTANEQIHLPSNFEQTFTFGIEADEATAKLTGWESVKDTVEIEFNNTGSKVDAFSIKFTEAGTYTFEVKETTPGTGYVKTDKTVYTVVYTVTEDSGKLTATPTIKKGNETADEVAFVNTYGSFSISGEKVWQDADKSLRLNVTEFSERYLELYTVDATGKQTKVTGYAINPDVPSDEAYLTVYKEGDDCFYWNFIGLPAYDDDGNALTYVVKELTVKGYQTFYVNNTGTGAQPDGIYEEAPRPAVTDRTYSIYNTLAEGTLTIEKTVEVQGNVQPDTLPEFQFTITPAEGLTGYHFMDAEGKALTSPVTVAVEKKADGTIAGTLPVTILFDSFTEAEKEFAFTVAEVKPAPIPAGWTYDATEQTVTFTVMRNQSAFEPSDSLSMSQPVVVAMDSTSGGTASFTNTYKEVEKTDVIITKFWANETFASKDKVPNIADKLTLCKLVNGNPVKVENAPTPTHEATDADRSVYTWSGLPKYDENGKLITYTVKESGIPGYVVSYEPLHVGEDADQEVAKDFAFTGETITNTYYETKGEVEFEGGKVLNGRDMKAGEFTFILTDVHGNEIQRVTNAADGSFAFDAIEFTAEDVPYGESLPAIYRIYEAKGDLPGMAYDTTEYVIELLLTDNKAGKIIAEPVGGSLPEIKFTNTYEEKVYEAKGEVEFDGVKVLKGRDMKAGEFTFILTDKAGKELQRVTNAADGTFAFEPIKYTEKDVPYGKDVEFTYYITELAGNLPGVTYDTTKYEIVVGLWDDAKGTIHVGDISECVNEIVFTNTYEAEGSVTFKGAKSLLGREFKQGDEFTFELLNEKGDVIDTVTINPTSGAKADFAFKTIKYELADAGKTYTYTYRVKEKAGAEEGMTYDDTVHTVTVKVSDAGNGTLQVEASKNADALNFTNTYLAEGTVLFSGTKTMNGKTLEGKDFTFVLTDADGKEIESVTNDKDGKIVFSAIQYKLEDAGKTFTYKVSEKNDGKKSVTYDDTVYTVTVKVEDAGNGHLKVTASDNATKLNFTNSYEAKAVLTMNAYKTVNGYKPSVNQVYDFVLLCDDGTEMKAQNKDEVITFGTIGFDEEDVGKTFIYTVKETTEANELLEVDAAIYQVAVTVVDNGDGNLKLETEILKDGKRANGVVFANTATATLAISKTVKGPGPDKAFDLKVTFIGVDGKALEGVYDYDGDVKGTITSGGVIALKDGQSVTIVGLPEGATYTVEENAGPAYTVTVNGKPIAKAEGTLVGHGKLEFINTVEVTTFSVTKVWEGTDLGEITLTLYADGKQITPQPEVTREGDKYTYYNLPKYNEEGEEIVYSAKERGIDGYIRIYNNVEPYQKVTGFVHDGGTIINREIEEEVHELSFKIHKVWTGVEATEEIPAITLTLYCNGDKLDVPTPKPDSEGWYRYYDLPKTVNGQIAVYTVVEEPIPGYTVTYKTASGEVVEEGVNGGEIINAKIPQTGDPATLGLWLALMGASAVLLTMLQRRRKA